METIQNGCGRFLRGFLIGGFLGAVAGILLAPKSGKELRSDLKQKGSEALEEAKHVYGDTMGKAETVLEDARRRAKELKGEADRLVSEACFKARSILCGVEGRKERAPGCEAEEIGGEA
jgi:gas vesicle protein